MKSTEAEESDDSSEKWLRGANVFSVSAGHISLRARKCSDILLALGVLSPPLSGYCGVGGWRSLNTTDYCLVSCVASHTSNH